jgi:hypothetical protein
VYQDWPRTYVNKLVLLHYSQALFLDFEIWIKYNFQISQNIISLFDFFLLFKNIRTIFSVWTKSKK